MDVREKLVELLSQIQSYGVKQGNHITHQEGKTNSEIASHLIDHGVTVQEWINSEEMFPQFPCLALDANGNSVSIPDGILTIKDNHGEWCINASLAKEVRLVDGTKIDVLLWENRIAYWMPLPQPPKGE